MLPLSFSGKGSLSLLVLLVLAQHLLTLSGPSIPGASFTVLLVSQSDTEVLSSQHKLNQFPPLDACSFCEQCHVAMLLLGGT